MIERDGEIQRVFTPIQWPQIDHCDLVLHLSTFLQDNAKRRDKNGYNDIVSSSRDFYHVQKEIEIFRTFRPSSNDVDIYLLISINGGITNDEYINFLRNIDGLHENNTHFIVFQRPNFGYQWGGFYDVWSKYKDINCTWYMSKESDWHLNTEYWFDRLIDKYNEISRKNGKIGYIGGGKRKIPFNDIYEYNGPLNKETWRDQYNNTHENPTLDFTMNVDPRFMFCHKDYLNDLDRTYGQFTYALDDSYYLGAIVYSEIGFYQKSVVKDYIMGEYHEISENEDY